MQELLQLEDAVLLALRFDGPSVATLEEDAPASLEACLKAQSVALKVIDLRAAETLQEPVQVPLKGLELVGLEFVPMSVLLDFGLEHEEPLEQHFGQQLETVVAQEQLDAQALVDEFLEVQQAYFELIDPRRVEQVVVSLKPLSEGQVEAHLEPSVT